MDVVISQPEDDKMICLKRQTTLPALLPSSSYDWNIPLTKIIPLKPDIFVKFLTRKSQKSHEAFLASRAFLGAEQRIPPVVDKLSTDISKILSIDCQRYLLRDALLRVNISWGPKRGNATRCNHLPTRCIPPPPPPPPHNSLHLKKKMSLMTGIFRPYGRGGSRTPMFH